MSQSDEGLIQAAIDGDAAALEALFNRCRLSLMEMIASRLDRRVAVRVDAADVVQEVYIEVARRLNTFAKNQVIEFDAWVRFLAKQKLNEILRRNIGAQSRDVRREVPMHYTNAMHSSMALSAHLQSKIASPSSIISKEEVARIIRESIEKLDDLDREVLLLRHVEQLKTREAAERLGITQNTCRQRHIRALKHLRQMLLESDLHWSGV